jgi:hypothetical protein
VHSGNDVVEQLFGDLSEVTLLTVNPDGTPIRSKNNCDTLLVSAL